MWIFRLVIAMEPLRRRSGPGTAQPAHGDPPGSPRSEQQPKGKDVAGKPATKWLSLGSKPGAGKKAGGQGGSKGTCSWSSSSTARNIRVTSI